MKIAHIAPLMLATLAHAEVTSSSVSPADTDPAIKTFVSPHWIYVNRGVVVEHKAELSQDRHELYLFIPGTHAKGGPRGRGPIPFCNLAADLGYHVIVLSYPDEVPAAVCRNDIDPDAFEDFRMAIIQGGRSKHISIERPESIENRLIKLLQHLEKLRPKEKWAQFLNDNGTIKWESIAVGGQSQGGGHAALIGIKRRVARVICTGAPKDYNHKRNEPAAFYRKESATPKGRFFAFNHRQDYTGDTSPHQLLSNLKALELDAFGPPADVDSEAFPYHHARILMTGYLAPNTEFLGAIRLPNTAFKQNAGTEVTTDIVMLRKLHPGETPRGAAWRELRDFTNHDFIKIPINEYFVERPHLMLGHLQLTGRMYRDNEPTLEGDGRVLGDALAGAIPALPAGIYHAQRVELAEPATEQTIPAPDFVKPNAYCVHDGIVCIREENVLRRLNDLPSDTRSRIRGLIQVRDTVRLCLRSQMDASSEDQVVEARKQLNYTYDRFVSRFGPVSLRANQRAFDGDPDLPLLLSLEHYNDETKRATKATIFHERTIHHRQPIQSVSSPKEALLVSLNERGRVDLDHMAGLLNKPTEEFMPDLKGIIFLSPQTNEWETDDQYLSGNVREKLTVAEAAAVTDPRFAENVEALKSVQPADLSATEIDVRLGASWLPPEDVKQFTHELLNIPSGVEIGHVHALGTWHINGNWEARGATANTTDWGTDRYTALELIEDALNLKTPTVYDMNEEKKPVVNAQATEAAREKQERIKERFKEWIWSDDSRRERLCRLYNDTFNHTRLRTFNGDHLTLPGASEAIKLHGHQKAGVWRILQTPNTLLAHVVGAGKTYTMVAAAMELKRLGFARKPVFAVPNHMLGQFSTELLTLYPGANILVAGKLDFESQNRKKLFSRIATGNWDAVIVTHSGFERIPLARETQERFFEEQLHELEMIKRQLADSSNRRLVKEIERAKKRLEARLQALAAEHKKDNTLTFEELGVDRLFVDEAHYFKNLFYVTKMTRIAGLPQTASERAFDMYLKVRHSLRQPARHRKSPGGRGVNPADSASFRPRRGAVSHSDEPSPLPRGCRNLHRSAGQYAPGHCRAPGHFRRQIHH